MLSQRIATNIGKNDRVVIYPSFASLSPDRETWQIPVTGTVFEAGDVCRRKRLVLKLLQRLSKFHPNAEQREIFEERVNAFIARTSRGKQVAVRIGEHVYSLETRTDRNGVFASVLHMPVTAVDELERGGFVQDGWLQLEVIGRDGANTGFCGAVRMLERSGNSVISDIDDTLKVTHVTRKRALLANTFLRDFQAVEGMSAVYRRWAAAGTAFHYVSSSPWQLFGPLRQLFEQSQLPRGAFHLSSFTFRNHLLHRVWMLRKRAKLNVMKTLLQCFPERKFALIGDSGERDPEIYAALARRFPHQISGIYIRELVYRPMSDQRRELAFQNVDPNCLHIFREPNELPETLVR